MYFPAVRSCRYPRINDHLLVHRITDILGTYIHTGLLKSIRDMHITYGGANILMLVTGKILCENQQFRLACGYLHWLFVVDSEFLATYVILQPLQVHFYLGWNSFQVELEETETSLTMEMLHLLLSISVQIKTICHRKVLLRNAICSLFSKISNNCSNIGRVTKLVSFNIDVHISTELACI